MLITHTGLYVAWHGMTITMVMIRQHKTGLKSMAFIRYLCSSRSQRIHRARQNSLFSLISMRCFFSILFCFLYILHIVLVITHTHTHVRTYRIDVRSEAEKKSIDQVGCTLKRDMAEVCLANHKPSELRHKGQYSTQKCSGLPQTIKSMLFVCCSINKDKHRHFQMIIFIDINIMTSLLQRLE